MTSSVLSPRPAPKRPTVLIADGATLRRHLEAAKALHLCGALDREEYERLVERLRAAYPNYPA